MFENFTYDVYSHFNTIEEKAILRNDLKKDVSFIRFLSEQKNFCYSPYLPFLLPTSFTYQQQTIIDAILNAPNLSRIEIRAPRQSGSTSMICSFISEQMIQNSNINVGLFSRLDQATEIIKTVRFLNRDEMTGTKTVIRSKNGSKLGYVNERSCKGLSLNFCIFDNSPYEPLPNWGAVGKNIVIKSSNEYNDWSYSIGI